MTENTKSYNNTNPFSGITVIADDITGAAEIAGVCLRYGLEVSFSINSVPDSFSDIQVIATDSRSLSENDAYTVHKNLIEAILKKTPETLLFKKCDSALRGHILTEITALTELTGNDKVLLQPANPKTDRYILNGTYIINDQLIENTAFAHDPDFPALTSLVEMLLTSRTNRNWKEKIYTGKIERIFKAGVYIPDCSTIPGMKQCLKLYNDDTLLVGSAAFFEQFLKFRKLISCQKTSPEFIINDNYLIVSGSTHSESGRFRLSLEKLNCPVLPLFDKLLSPDINEKDILEFVDNVYLTLKSNNKLCLTISDKNIEFENSSAILKKRLSSIVKTILKNTEINELFVEGGATAYDILMSMGFKTFKPVSELAPGVVRMQSGDKNNFFLTIKPGSYNWPNNLFH